ncbi:NAD(P)-dependent oxidoreductase [Glycomyces artemisiae]|uniref:3-hydroxyisobutyrate dehydrogenase-like beta-hydroxyacid dehydrogenase n=1 Tax=Glycomyces artemisiae TaxID=1076443 RepID=A0A2T0U564_9ACTN|nr:NAD(P)-binding domain-containing protein [Glycomyces artemisiae]PRY52978.1 3-hydroxyisobutyrate dehydrogenase-like beta-hydroxyacid dehydrogenase [Glycomyces artemisiae]
MPNQTVAVLGLGAMGSAITERLRDTGYATVVWNRTAARTAPHAAAGSRAAATAAEAVAAADTVLVVLFDDASVREHLDPLAADLKGRTVVNLTTTTPDQARATAAWAAEHGLTYLDGAIMATPDMIGTPVSRLLYSGDRAAYDGARAVLEVLGAADYEGEDAGLASLKDMALLTAMYQMFAGFMQAAAMMRTVGVPAADTAAEIRGWLGALLPHLDHFGAEIDRGDFDPARGQDVEFTRAAIGSLITAARGQGVSAVLLEPLMRQLDELSATGRGGADWISVIDQLPVK